MSSVNKVILIGNLGADPEVRFMTNGNAVANLRIATTEAWKDKNTGERREQTEWHRVVFYGRQAEVCGEYLKKGASIYIEGKIQTRKWQDKEGKDQYTTEIVGSEMKMLGRREKDANEPGNMPEKKEEKASSQKSASARQEEPAGFGSMDDDIPF